jgi:K+-sensing histidine kinase KdpD
MDNRYTAVLCMYFRRPTGLRDGLLPALGLLAFAVAFLTGSVGPRWSRPDLFTTFTVGIAVGLVGAGLWSKLREQVMPDRRHLWPDYVAPHVGVFIVLAIVTTCVGP